MTTAARVRVAVLLAGVLTACAPTGTSPAPAPTSTAVPPTTRVPMLVPGAGPAVLTPIAVSPIADIAPVLGADDRVHLAYELAVTNLSSEEVHLRSVTVLDGTHGDATLSTLDADALGRLFRPAGDSPGPSRRPGESGYLFVDAALAPDAPLPRLVRHRFALATQPAQAPEDVGPRDADPAPPPMRDLDFTGVPVAVTGQPAVTLAPPLRGSGWVVANGCCDTITSHRGAVLPINGTVHAAERFAVDLVQLDAQRRLYSGPPTDVTSYPYFGTEVLSAADGMVVAAEDGMPEQTPGKLPDGITVQTAAGNHVVVDLGEGRFALYAHLQPGSLRVRPGQQVRTGDVIGRLGNSGNTDAPHLHFHVMDGPSPLESNGLPFVLSRFTGEGVVAGEEALEETTPGVAPVIPVDRGRLAGPHRDQLPLNLQMVGFG